MVTIPDRPRGRGLRIRPNPVKEKCEKLGILTLAPASLKEVEDREKVRSLQPDVFVVASYGKLIPGAWLSLPRKAALNIHPSLLPKYRGAAPISWQIIDGEQMTGVTLAIVTKDLDAGDIVAQIRIPLEPHETTASLTQHLARLAQKALGGVFENLEKGRLERTPQEKSKASYARKLTKVDGHLDLGESAIVLERKVRAFYPWPGAFIALKKIPLRILEVKVDSVSCAEAKPGTLLEISARGFLRVQTGKGSLEIFKIQLPGRRPVSGNEFANGQRLKAGAIFENVR